jgi:dipeptidyl aminopeptidase/acylaminoacyl peptidase
MSLPAGTRFGPYEVVALIGAGGMGAVYRARDTRLGRDVAVKVLPAEFSADADRLRRFEQEARSASALNHPNILTIFDVGEQASIPYVVSELLEGETLRQKMTAGLLPQRKAIDYALQMAKGLAAAHEMGIVHRDLKPENLFVTKDGRLKILDFGLAKLASPRAAPSAETNIPTTPVHTESGLIVGTAGYMSPEQVRGQAADHRSDLFSFGSVLYEMLTGQRAFARETGVETMSAVLKEDPPLLAAGSDRLPAGIDRIVRRCLEKSREERFQSSSDLAFALESLSGFSTASGAVRPIPEPPGARLRWRLAGAAALAAVAILAYVLGARSQRLTPPTYRQLTFRRGPILTARFSRDGETVIYGAAWDGAPFQIFTVRPESPESSALPLPPADLLSISPTGELAVSQDRRFVFAWMNAGTLSRVPLAGGTPRQVLEGAQDADWSPDGASLAAVRRVAGRHRLEFPIGKTLYETAGWVSHPRVSADGARVAFIDHPIYGDDRGVVAVVDLQGQRRQLTPEWSSAQGLAWSPDGREIWFTASEKGLNSSLRAVTLAKGLRTVTNAVGRLTLLDVSRRGRVLLARDQSRVGIIGRSAGESSERELSWLDSSGSSQISADGQWVLFSESGEGGGPRYGAYLRKMDGSPAVRLGDGQATDLSRDGKWALSIEYGGSDTLKVLPTGAGEARTVPRGTIARFHWSAWLPGSSGLLFTGNEAGKGLRIYLQAPIDGTARPVTPEGIGYLLPATPDGKFVPSTDSEGRVRLYPLDGRAEPQLLQGLKPGDWPLSWSRDGRFAFVRRRGDLPVAIDRLDRSTGRSEPWRSIVPADRSGILGISAVSFSEDGQAYVYTYHRLLSELYLVEGLR